MYAKIISKAAINHFNSIKVRLRLEMLKLEIKD